MSDHHQRSRIRNLAIGATQVTAGLVMGSPELLYAGTHNSVDGPVHELRHMAEHADTKSDKRKFRIRAALLMGGSGVLAFAVDRVIPMHSIGSKIVLGLFATETVINVSGALDATRSGSNSTDTKSGLLHNAGDAFLSGTTTAILAAPSLGADLSPVLASNIASWGHLAVIGVLSTYGMSTINKD